VNFIVSLDNISQVTNYLKNNLPSNCIVLLQGDLASGKTTLVQSYVELFDKTEKVTSPTFSLQTIYSNNIYHYDIYNTTLSDFISLGLLEEFEKDGIHFVEWGDNQLKKILKEYGFETIVIKINKLDNKREYNIGT